MRMIAVLLTAMLGSSSAIAAQAKDPVGDKAMREYVLTMPKVKAYETAAQDVEAAIERDASLRDESDKADNEPDQTYADIKAKFARHPRLYAFFSKQGLSQDDAVLIPLTLIAACTVAQVPQTAAALSEKVSPPQIAFCKSNLPVLQAMKFFGSGTSGKP